MKYYLVPFYSVNAELGNPNRGKMEMMDKVMIMKNEFDNNFYDIITGAYFPVYVDWQFDGGILRRDYVNTRTYHECGYQLIVKKEDINEQNIATEKQLISYVEGYENSKWKRIHDEIVTTVGTKYIKSNLR